MTGAVAVVLAAGTSTRYRAAGGRAETKLVAAFQGEPMIRHAVRTALAASCAEVVVVTGHARQAVEQALAGFPVRFIHNRGYASGLASSLRTGLNAVDSGADAVVFLGDMPLIEPGMVRALMAGAAADPAIHAVVPVTADRIRGNPVLIRRALFPAAVRLTGDEGARRLLRDPSVRVLEIEVNETARRDFDEPDPIGL